jgi:serine/threonine protein kinase/serine phosphatase RsbU (regulator of sigma subunit)
MAQPPIANQPQGHFIPGVSLGPELGRGAESVVYQAFREGKKVAVKIRHGASTPQDDAGLRVRREAAFAARLRHPGLASIMEVGEASARAYMVMEFVEGPNLAEHIQQRGVLSQDEIISIGAVLASALAEVHRFGMVHRDIKPQNILLANGQPKLIDFGFAKQTNANDQRPQEGVVGTLLYSAPEQIGMLKRPVDGRADLYALGATLYECATGHPPFQTRDINELLRQHAAFVPPEVREINARISPALSQIIAKLLAKDPDDRYQSGNELAAEFARVPELDAQLQASRQIVLGQADVLSELTSEVPLIGRESELEQLRRKWKETLRGHGSVLLVEGQPGTGKSRLVRELMDGARRDLALVLSCKCTPSDPIPFGPLRKAIDAYLRRVKRLPAQERRRAEQAAREAIGDYGPLFKRFSPTLSALIGETRESPDLGDAHDTFYIAVSELLLAVGKGHPATVLYIDDVQWLDDASRQVIKRLSDRLAGASFMIATTARNDPDSMAGLNRFIADVGTALEGRLTTAPLQVEDVGRLVAEHLGGIGLAPPFVRQLAGRTGGNPFAIGEYIRAMLDAGLLRPFWGSWVVDTAGLDKLQLSTDAVQLVVKRIDSLDDHTREVLSAAAMLGARFQLDYLPAVCGGETGIVNAAIAQATQARLIERGEGGDYAFVHDRVQEALLARLDKNQQRSLHQIIAEAMDSIPSEGTEYVSGLARHYALGQVSRNPKRVYETNLEAGLNAMQDYADEEAYGFLQKARAAALQGGLTPDASLFQALGEVCARTARQEEAIENINAALERTKDPLRRANIRTRLILVHTVNMDMDQAWAESKKAFAEAGSPWPRFGLFLSTLYLFFAALFMRWTGIGYGTARGKTRERFSVVAKIYEIAIYVGYFKVDDVLFLQMCMRGLYLANRLGPSRGLSVLYGNYGVVMGVLKINGVAQFYARTAIKIAEQLGDRALIARERTFQAYTTHFGGNAPAGEELHSRNLDEMGRWMDPNDYMKGCIDLASNLQARGYLREAWVWTEKALQRSRINERNDDGAGHHYHCYGSGVLAALGRPREAAEHIRTSFRIVESLPTRYSWGEMLSQKMFYLYEQEEYGSELDDTIRRYQAIKLLPFQAYHVRLFHLYHSYIRLEQCLALQGNRTAAIKTLKKAMSPLGFSLEHHLRCHHQVLKASVAWLEGNSKKALKLLQQADATALDADSVWASFEIAKLRARILIENGNNSAAKRELRFASWLAVQNGWSNRSRRLQREFGAVAGLGSVTSSPSGSVGASAGSLALSQTFVGGESMLPSMMSSHTHSSNGTHSGSGTRSSGPGGLHLQRRLDAVLEVSLAAAGSFDPEEQSRATLDKLIQILGAERAYLFLLDEANDRLELKAGRSADQQDLTELTAYSSTVIDKVLRTNQPLVMSGNDDGEISASESVVAHGLRSIIAAPLMRRERLVGVVYLDNRLAKGLFTDDDVGVLLALSNHIAISLEAAKLAQVEKERASFEKDLAVTTAVQSLLLPAQDTVTVPGASISALYRPAAQSGGDWWWYERRSDGKIWVLIGDVTGHGVGPAMVTAAVASSYRTLRRTRPLDEPPAVLSTMNANFQDLCGEAYRMTLSAVEIDPARNQLRWWSAGAPPLMILKKEGRVEVLNAKGTPLGSTPFEPGLQRAPFSMGDRLLLFSDGVSESVTASNRPFGLRRLHDVLHGTQGQNTEEAKRNLLKALDDARGNEIPQEDDITFAVIDRL